MSSVKVTHQAKKKKVKGVADISCAGKTKVKQGLRRTKLSQKKKKKKEEIKERKGSHFPQREYDRSELIYLETRFNSSYPDLQENQPIPIWPNKQVVWFIYFLKNEKNRLYICTVNLLRFLFHVDNKKNPNPFFFPNKTSQTNTNSLNFQVV